MKLILLFKKIKGYLDKKKKLYTPCKYATGEEAVLVVFLSSSAAQD